jgi:hypothetical protein
MSSFNDRMTCQRVLLTHTLGIIPSTPLPTNADFCHVFGRLRSVCDEITSTVSPSPIFACMFTALQIAMNQE